MSGITMAPWDPVFALEEQAHGRVRAFSAGRLAFFQGGRPTGVSIPIVAYVLRVGDLTLAVDAGLAERHRDPAAELAPEDGPAPGMRYRPVLEGPSFAEQLAAEGIVPDRVVCTHLHQDHAGGVGALRLPVEASAAELASAPSGDLAGLELRPLGLDGGPVGSFSGHQFLAPGVLALATPGHTPGSISVFACLGQSWALLCGDAAYPVADQPRSPAFTGMLRIRRALDEIGGTLVLAGHDTAVLRACAGGVWLGQE